MSDLKLPDFREHGGFNEIRRRMGAPLIEYDSDQPRAERITRKDLERLRTTGIIVDPDDIETLANGVFSYQGVPVLLYIYSPTQWTEKDIRLPRYHLCNCRTWQDMKAKGRQDRYVASTRVDGYFELDLYISSLGASQKKVERLRVCQNCLDKLSWKGFHNDGTLSSAERSQYVEAFALAEFFEHYGRSMVREKPKWTPDTIPTGSYSDDFDEVSARARAAARWRCQGPCARLLAESWQRRYLHVHHVNGVKGDNSPENLRVLCLECHSKQPDHGHLKNSPQYLEFMELFNGQGAVQRERILAALHRTESGDTTGTAKREPSRTNGSSKPKGNVYASSGSGRLVDRLRLQSLEVIDLRSHKGSLWVVGDESLRPFFEKLRREGIPFTFARNGSRSTGHRPAWFSMSRR